MKTLQSTDIKWIELKCTICNSTFSALSYRARYCQSCVIAQKEKIRENFREQVKSSKLEDKKSKETKRKKIILTNAEQRKIDIAICMKIHSPPDPGRVLQGEEFTRIAALYQK